MDQSRQPSLVKYLPKGSIRIITNNHEQLMKTTDTILRELPEVTGDKLGQLINIVTVGDRLLGVLMRYFGGLASELNTLRFLCTLQKYVSAWMLAY